MTDTKNKKSEGKNSLKKLSTKELESHLETFLAFGGNETTTTNAIIFELMSRGVDKDEVIKNTNVSDESKGKIKKAFDVLDINLALGKIGNGGC